MGADCSSKCQRILLMLLPRINNCSISSSSKGITSCWLPVRTDISSSCCSRCMGPTRPRTLNSSGPVTTTRSSAQNCWPAFTVTYCQAAKSPSRTSTRQTLVLPSTPSPRRSYLSSVFIRNTSNYHHARTCSVMNNNYLFGIHGSVLNWFKSYLSSRTFCVKCNDCFSSLHTSLYGVPRGSVLGPLLFIMYTTPLNTLISSLSLYHHLYADDIQLFSLLSSLRLSGKHLTPPECSHTDHFLDDF